MKILIFSNIPAPYFVNYLNELGKYATVKAYFERRGASDRDKSWKNIGATSFQYDFFDGIEFGPESALSFKIISTIKANKDSIIIFANPTTPTGIVGITYCKNREIQYVLQSEGGFAKSGNGVKERFKRKLLQGAALYLTGMKPEEDYFTAYGAPINKVKQYPFASLSEKDLIKAIPTNNEKMAIRNQLGITCKNMLLYVGRMLPGKGIDVLIRACKGIDNDTHVYLVGGKETEEYSCIAEECNVTNFFYIDHLHLDELKKYYLAADFLILPTRGDTWGLVVNEAMSFGLPVITTEKCVAGTQLIENYKGGFIIKNEDSRELRSRIDYLVNHPDECRKMGNNNFQKIQGHTYENMARIIFETLKNY